MRKSILLIGLVLSGFFVISQPLITLQPIVSGLTQPVDMVEANDGTGRFFIVEKTGRIKIVNNGTINPTPFLNISNLIVTSGEQGFLSMAFHPEYTTNGYFYVYYNNTSGNITIARYSRLNSDAADPASGVILMSIPKSFTNHNGGKLLFGPGGFLYFATGDGGSSGDPQNNAQNNASLLGKMLRIDVNNPNPPYYNIPPTNPFATSTTFKREIIANGLRNPWRWSFDRQNNDMWIADVGQNQYEEVNVVRADSILNRNYGWRCFEGTHVFNTSCSAQPNNVVPVFDYPHNGTNGGYSVTGGYVYRGTEYPALFGYYIFADYATGHVWLTNTNDPAGYTITIQRSLMTDITSFAETSNRTLYAITINGTIYKVVATGTLPIKLVSFSGKEAGNKFELTWKVQNEEKGDVYIIESRSNQSEAFKEINRTASTANRQNNQYSLQVDPAANENYYRLKIISITGQTSYSQTIRYGKKVNSIKAYVTNTGISVSLPANAKNVTLLDEVGRTIWSKAKPSTTLLTIQTTYRGVITVRALVGEEVQVVRVVR